MRGTQRYLGRGSGRPPRRPLVVAAGIVAVLIALGSPLPAGAESTPSPETALEQLNIMRENVGVEPVVLDDALTDGCRQHASYLRVNPLARGHAQDAAAPGYTDAGHLAARTSVLAYGRAATAGVAAWEPPPYHRMALLNPRLLATGYWSEFGLACMNVTDTDSERRTAELQAYTYPASGQQDVATAFACNESPNPCLTVPGNDGRTPTGFNISVQFNGPWAQVTQVQVGRAAITAVPGTAVPLTVDSRSSALRSGFLIIPRQPLTPGTTYSVSASGSVVGQNNDGSTAAHPFGVSWDFSTPGIAPAASMKVAVTRITRSHIRLRIGLISSEPRRARVSLMHKQTPLVRVVRRLTGRSQTIVLKRPRERVTTISVLLRGSATQAGVAARLQTSIKGR